MTGPTATVKARIFTRDRFACYHCGTDRGLTIQHRANRGMGGSKLRDNPSNLLSLCYIANGALESDALFARRGRLYGWKLESWQNPLEVRVWDLGAGEWVYLDDDYNRLSEAAA